MKPERIAEYLYKPSAYSKRDTTVKVRITRRVIFICIFLVVIFSYSKRSTLFSFILLVTMRTVTIIV